MAGIRQPYPQKWDYYRMNTGTFDSPGGAVAQVVEVSGHIRATRLGDAELHGPFPDRPRHRKGGTAAAEVTTMDYRLWSATAIFKRPLAS